MFNQSLRDSISSSPCLELAPKKMCHNYPDHVYMDRFPAMNQAHVIWISLDSSLGLLFIWLEHCEFELRFSPCARQSSIV